MSQLFNSLKVASNSRSTFDLSHHQVTTSDFGYLTPICLRHMVPNDDFVVKPNIFCRLAPLAVPTYGRIMCRVHHFFVPYRILYGHWDSFITGDSSNHTIPPYFTNSVLTQLLAQDKAYSSSGTLSRGSVTSVMSNFGLNPSTFPNQPGDFRYSAFPWLAYWRIWLDYFADSTINDHPSLVSSFNELTRDGGELSYIAAALFCVRQYVCFKKDYFTSARRSPQDGDPSRVAVSLPGSDLNPGLNYNSSSFVGLSGKGDSAISQNNTSAQSVATNVVGQFTIEALRAANSLQRYLERNNFVGTRIINRILAHFGIEPEAERLDMAEFIGGSSFPIQIGDVTSTNSNKDSDGRHNVYGLGYQAGKGVGASSGDTVHYHAKEHGIFMSLMSILPDTGYYQGVSRFWTKGTTGDRLDFFHPEFENLGFQEVLNGELYVPESISDYQSYRFSGIFGFQPRYSEYKFQQDVLGGDFVLLDPMEDDNPNPMGSPDDSFHLFRRLYYTDSNPIALNANFVQCVNSKEYFDRIFQFTDNEYDHFYFNVDVDVKATRPMSGFGEPALDANNSGDGRTVNLPYGGTRL